jgi:hypothetical protein
MPQRANGTCGGMSYECGWHGGVKTGRSQGRKTEDGGRWAVGGLTCVNVPFVPGKIPEQAGEDGGGFDEIFFNEIVTESAAPGQLMDPGNHALECMG